MATYENLTSNDDLEAFFESSMSRPALLFKHSLTCPISGTAFREYQKFLDEQPDSGDVGFGLIEIQKARELSNDVSGRTGIRHESPQALLIRNGEVTWHASHFKIRADTLKAAIED